ncbi:MAG: hypothetical protein RIE77_09120 [Phycisphaerales bacterium]|jgi:uncharacterized protein YbaR (Trm112 family)
MKSETPSPAGPGPLPEQLRCPITGKQLALDASGEWVNVVGEPIRYPIRKGIPVLVPPAAEKLERPGA